MRLEDLPRAARLLGKYQELLPANVLDFLMGDPALRMFSDRQGLKSFQGM